MMNQLTFERGEEVIPEAAEADWQRQERTHLENLWQDTVEPFRVVGDAWKNDRQQFTQETLRAINLAFNPVLKDEKGKYYFNTRAVVYWGGLAVIGLGVLYACKMINNPDGGGTSGSKTPTPESLCPDLIRIAAANSVDVASRLPAWQAADKVELEQDLACFAPEASSLTIGEILTVGQNAGEEVVQVAWSRAGKVTPLLAVSGETVDVNNDGTPDLQLVNFLDPHTNTSQWEALTPDQAQAQLAAVNINSATGEIEPENNGAMITATRDFNNNISFQINNPDGTQVTLSQDQVKNNLALEPWLTQVENLLKGQEILTFDVVLGVDLSAAGEKFSLPQEVFAAAREKHLAPIEAEGENAACTTDSCTVMLTDVLVSGAKLKGTTDGKVIYSFDGEVGSEALFRFSGLPDGVKATAFVAQDGNPWDFQSGTVVVWFWEGGDKGPAAILNEDNPLQIIADKPNSISLTAIDNGLLITRTGPDGVMIDEQTVSFLPPLPSEFLGQFDGTGFSVDGVGLVYNTPSGEKISVPGSFDTTGFTATLDSGREISIKSENLGSMFKVDSEYNLLKIYAENGVISAEYDPDQKSWVDIQKLADNLVCQEGPTCFTDARGTPIPGGIDVELSSTGIFRSVDALDRSTGEVIGNFLLTQMVTKDKEMVPATVWVLVQAESFSEPDVNAFMVGVRTIRYRLENKLADQSEYLMLYPVQKWQEWMPKGSAWTLEFSKKGYLYPFLTFIERSQIMADKNKLQAIDFLTNSGISSGNDFILTLIASAARR